MRRLLFALLFAASPLQASTVTTKTAVTNAAWRDLGAGPLMLSFSGAGTYVVGDVMPTIPISEGFGVLAGDTAKIKATSHVWAAAAGAPNANAYSAPYVPAVSPNCAQAATYLARTTGGNEGGNALAIKNLICGLVSDGVITGNLSGATGGCGSHLDTLWIIAQQNVTDATLNLCGTSYSLSPGAATFTAYKGFQPIPGVILTGFNPTTAPSPLYTQNNASFGMWPYTAPPETISQFGIVGSALFDNFTTDGFFYGRINGACPPSGASPAIGGLYIAERRNSTTCDASFNGVDRGTVSLASAAPSSNVFSITNGSVQTQTVAFVGGSMGPTLNLALYNRLRIYMTAIGVP